MATSVTSVAGYYHLGELARGGMGTVAVVLRREGSFERLYALKRLRETYREDKKVRAMFLTEARIAGLVRHPNVVSVLDVGEDQDGPFLLMDYIDGVSVRALMTRLESMGQALPLPLVLKIIADAARGLHAAHHAKGPDGSRLSIVHRDVSPHNLLLGFDGLVRVVDFGVAKVRGHLAQTEHGVLKGKLGYMAPEQLSFEEFDHRSDLFGLGVVLFELLAGRRLYGAEGMTAARRILHEAPPDLGEERVDLPPTLIGLSFSLLAKQVAQRPKSALAVAEELDRIRSGLDDAPEPTLADYLSTLFARERDERTTKLEAAVRSARQPPKPSRRRWVYVGAAALVLPAVLFAGLTLTSKATPKEEASEAAIEAAVTLVDGESEDPTPEPTIDEPQNLSPGPSPIDSPPPPESPAMANGRMSKANPRPRAMATMVRSRPTAPMAPPQSPAPMALPRDDIWSDFE